MPAGLHRLWQALWLQRRQRHRRQGQPGPEPVAITALSDLPGLIDEHVAEAAYLPDLNESNIYTWLPANASGVTMTYYGDGYGPPQLVPDAWGVGRHAVFIQGGKLTGSLALATGDLTCVFVGNHSPVTMVHPSPRFVSVANYTGNAEDWDSPDTWVCACYDSGAGMFVADRNWARPVALPMDTAHSYIGLTRKQGGVISGWLKTLGGGTATATGATTPQDLNLEGLFFGGNMNEGANLYGWLGHVGLWNRALSDAEALGVIAHLSTLYQ